VIKSIFWLFLCDLNQMVDEVTHHICKFVKVNLSNISAYCAILNIWIEFQYYLLVKKYIS